MRVELYIACGFLALVPLLNCSDVHAPPSDPIPKIETPPVTVQQPIPTGHRPAPLEHPGNPDDLVSTTWVAGAHTFSFQAGGNFVVRGGNFDTFAPGGVPGILKVRKGVLEMRVMGRINWGIWDGETLTINGIQAIRKEP